MGSTVVWLAPLPPSKKVLGSSFHVESACWISAASHRHVWYLNWSFLWRRISEIGPVTSEIASSPNRNHEFAKSKKTNDSVKDYACFQLGVLCLSQQLLIQSTSNLAFDVDRVQYHV